MATRVNSNVRLSEQSQVKGALRLLAEMRPLSLHKAPHLPGPQRYRQQRCQLHN